MKLTKSKVFLFLSLLYIVITGGLNLYGYFHLPKEIATQFSFSGDQVNHMPKTIYLMISFAAVLLISLFSTAKGQEHKLKLMLVNTIIVIANIIMIVTQL